MYVPQAGARAGLSVHLRECFFPAATKRGQAALASICRATPPAHRATTVRESPCAPRGRRAARGLGNVILCLTTRARSRTRAHAHTRACRRPVQHQLLRPRRRTQYQKGRGPQKGGSRKRAGPAPSTKKQSTLYLDIIYQRKEAPASHHGAFVITCCARQVLCRLYAFLLTCAFTHAPHSLLRRRPEPPR
jgi:hypothetical protein